MWGSNLPGPTPLGAQQQRQPQVQQQQRQVEAGQQAGMAANGVGAAEAATAEPAEQQQAGGSGSPTFGLVRDAGTDAALEVRLAARSGTNAWQLLHCHHMIVCTQVQPHCQPAKRWC